MEKKHSNKNHLHMINYDKKNEIEKVIIKQLSKKLKIKEKERLNGVGGDYLADVNMPVNSTITINSSSIITNGSKK